MSRPRLLLIYPAFDRECTPEALARRNQAETVKWQKAIRDAKIEPQ